MKGTNLGEFEELVLLIVASIGENAYSVAIADEIKVRTSRSAVISVVHSALNRLTEKGFVSSLMSGATEDRGGRRKRIFSVTTNGMRALELSKSQRDELWKLIPKARLAN